MYLLYWILFGVTAAIIANVLDPHPSGGILGTIILGISGAIIGGLLGSVIFDMTSDGVGQLTFILAVGTCVILLLVSRLLRRI